MIFSVLCRGDESDRCYTCIVSYFTTLKINGGGDVVVRDCVDSELQSARIGITYIWDVLGYCHRYGIFHFIFPCSMMADDS